VRISLSLRTGPASFHSIQEALNSVPKNNEHLIIILIKKGVYTEKLFITKSNIALVGEDKDSTRIVYAELRSNWTKAPNTTGTELLIVLIGVRRWSISETE